MARMTSALALGATLGLLLAGTAQATTLVYCSEGSPEGFNPQLYTAGTTFDASSKTIFNRLVEFERGTTTIIPGLAETWDISEDGLTYTFHLRAGVPFHSHDNFTPTRTLTADDVIYSFERQLDPENPYHNITGDTYEYFDGMSMGSLIDHIERVDDLTVRFVLTHPEAPFLANLAMDFASIMSLEHAEAMTAAGTPEEIDLNPVGTGPFVLVDYRQDAQIRYQAFQDYWNGPAAIDELVFSITPDASVRYARLQAGECHVMPYPNPADVPAMQADPNITVLEQEGLNVGYLAFNTEREPFTDPRVRRALYLAINKEAIIEAIFQGAAVPAVNPIPPTIWSYNWDIEDYPFDPEAARALLAEAGYPDGFTTNLWAMPVQRPYNPAARRMAEIIQANWAEIGVEAEIVTYEWGEYLARSAEGEHDTVLLGWTGDNGDPDNFMYVLLGCDAVAGGSNRSRWCYEPFDSLLRDAKLTTDLDERTRLYEEAQVIFHEETPWVPIAHSVVYMPVRNEVQDYLIDPFGGHIFYGVSLAE
ncbi:MAG: ABC transporter substrate-binding protein [Rhodospirillaceae bacterium]|nr:ABC transporter substrate-binding protein [Rhodospirillaceae bacterium]